VIRSLSSGKPISDVVLRAALAEHLSGVGRSDKRVLVIVPDDTRSLPMSTICETLVQTLAPRVKELALLVALGTHPPMTEPQLLHHFGPSLKSHPNVNLFQHAWKDPSGLTRVGTIPAVEIEALSKGLLSLPVPVTINRLALAYDFLLIVNPVFPHEVVGFSGGHKYFFPGISGSEILDISHWLGALITNPKINGHKDTPVRAMIERAATFIPTPRLGVSLVMQGQDLVGLFIGEVEEAWEKAVSLSTQVNIAWVEKPFHTVVSAAPAMYRDLWTAGKCMYKLEPVVAAGGRVVIYAPHLREISPTHGEFIRQIGYHTRDYFLAQWERFNGLPWTVLAHSTHVKGIGTFRNGVERPRVEVVLATGLPEEVCQKVNLGYLDASGLNLEDYADRREEGILLVPNAGEILYRLADGSIPDIDRL
jgi:nickel-dependent lactate racemase